MASSLVGLVPLWSARRRRRAQGRKPVRVNVDTAACIGAGQCALVAPDVFDQDDDGIVVVLNVEPSEPEYSATRRAAALCPARVIVVDESE